MNSSRVHSSLSSNSSHAHRISADTAKNLDDLLALDAELFVRCAYLTILRREPDPGGLVNYLGQLQAGVPKLSIVKELRWSIEGRANQVDLPGLLPKISEELLASVFTNGVPDDLDLEAILRHNGAPFVEAAYLALLGRRPDQRDLAHYLSFPETDAGKLEVLQQISQTHEYRTNGAGTLGRRKTPTSQTQPPTLLRRLWRLLRPAFATGTEDHGSPERQAAPTVESGEHMPASTPIAAVRSIGAAPTDRQTTSERGDLCNEDAIVTKVCCALPVNAAARALSSLKPISER